MKSPRSAARTRRRSIAFRAGVGVAALVVLLHVRDIAIGGQVELAAFDLEARLLEGFRHDAPDDRVVVVAIDDAASREALSRASPWQFYADLLEAITRAKPRIVGFDLFVTETLIQDRLVSELESLGNPASTVDGAHLANLMAQVGGRRLEAAIRATPFVLPYGCAAETVGALGTYDESGLDPSAFLRAAGAVPEEPAAERLAPWELGAFIHSGARFESATAWLGHTCESLDSDGVLRNDLAVIATTRDGQRMLLPSFPLIVAGLTLGVPPGSFRYEAGGVRIGERFVPIRNQGRTLIGFRGPAGSYRAQARQGHPSEYAALDVIAGSVPPDRLAGKVVVVGANWAGSREGRISPFGTKTSALERMAMEIDSIVSGRRLVARPPWAGSAGILFTVLAGCLAVAAGAGMRARLALAALAGGIFVIGAIATGFFASGIWIDSMFPALAWVFGGIGAASVRWYEVEAERRWIVQAFGMYAPPSLVEKVLEDPEAIRLYGEEREITVLFADLRGFTSQSERETPVETVARLNEHFSAMSEIVLRCGGTVDKFVGDAIMAFWGAPLHDPEHARHACDAALEMLRTLEQQNAERAARGLLPVSMGIGINSGPVVVGNMGADRIRVSYTAIGDAVNVASRLESLTKDLDLPVLVGEKTRELAGETEKLRFVPLGAQALKGKSSGVSAYALEDGLRPSRWRAIAPG